MKHYFIMAVLAGAFAVPTTALANEQFANGPYVGADFGFALPLKFKVDTKNSTQVWIYRKHAEVSTTYGAKIGYAFTPNIRADLSLHRTNAFIYKGVASGTEVGHKFSHNEDFNTRHKVASTVAMGNLYYDITEFDSQFVPFITLGLGVARNKSDKYTAQLGSNTIYTTTAVNNALAWGAGLGIWYQINNIYIDVMYRFLDLGNFKSGEKWYYTTYNANSSSTEEYFDQKPYKSKLNAHTFVVGTRITF